MEINACLLSFGCAINGSATHLFSPRLVAATGRKIDYDWLNDPISTIRIYENILHSGNVSVNGLVQEKAGEKSIFR